MSVSDHLLTLQWAQLKHDEAYHKDIVILPLAQRMKHMALHSAKYTAYFLTAVDDGDEARFQRTLTDAFIICLAVANTLNQNLGRELTLRTQTARCLSLETRWPERLVATTIHSG
jgi:hypothetical protein